jgi:protein-disulfide isomerase
MFLGKIAGTALISCALLSYSQVGLSKSVYSAGGKTVSSANLPDGLKQKFYDIEMEAFKKKEAAIFDQLFMDYVAKEIKKTGKSEQEVTDALLKVKEPTEKDLKDWYEKNKARIPYPFEQIKGQITQFMKSEQVGNAKKDFIQSLAKKEKLKLGFSEPTQPTIVINSSGFPSKGNKKAKVQIVEFADYHCPHCKHAYEAFKKLIKTQKEKFNLTFMDFPLRGEASHVIARGAYCADKQGKFWEFHDQAFSNQGSLNDKSPEAFAMALKLDQGKFKNCLNSDVARAHVDKAAAEGRRIGISGTPAIFINGKKYSGHHFEDLEQIIKDNS